MQLGLIITKQIIEASNGKLDFVSQENIGSTFLFSFEIEVIKSQPIIVERMQEEE